MPWLPFLTRNRKNEITVRKLPYGIFISQRSNSVHMIGKLAFTHSWPVPWHEYLLLFHHLQSTPTCSVYRYFCTCVCMHLLRKMSPEQMQPNLSYYASQWAKWRYVHLMWEGTISVSIGFLKKWITSSCKSIIFSHINRLFYLVVVGGNIPANY